MNQERRGHEPFEARALGEESEILRHYGGCLKGIWAEKYLAMQL